MNNNLGNDVNLKNSEVIKKILFSLIFVAKSKTSKDYAWGVIKNLLLDMRKEYEFLEFIKIDELKNLNDSIDDIDIYLDFDAVETQKIGEAIQKIIDSFKKRLGKRAGYFFLSEFKEVLGNRYYSLIKKMGVDLRLIDLHEEIYGYNQDNFQIKDKYNSNIAYLEKRD
jgi:hypothetical protein